MSSPDSAISTAAATHEASQWRRPGLMLLAGVAVAVGTTAAGVWIAPQLQSPAQLAAQAAPPSPSLVAAEVERRVLVEPVVLRGTVKPGASTKMYAAAAATGESSVITDVLVRRGERLAEGDVVAVRSGAPMVALALRFPLYRDLTAGVRGPDVREVQRALTRAGYRAPSTGAFDAQTQRAVQRLYSRHGFQAPTPAQPPVEEPSGGRDTPGGTELESQGQAAEPGEPVAGTAIPRSGVVLIDRADRRISAVHIKVGSILTDPRKPLLELDGADPYLSAVAGREQAALLHAGQKATVFDDTAGTKAAATVTSIGTRPVTNPDGQTGYEIRLRIAASTTSGGRSLRVDILASSNADKVLAVPVTAIYSAPDGHAFITVVDAQGRPEDTPVTTGRTAGGWTEFTPVRSGTVDAGTRVVVGETNTPAAGE